MGSTLGPLSSLLNFNPIMTRVGAAFQFTILNLLNIFDPFQFTILNLFNISCAYLDCEIHIIFLYSCTSIPKIYLISPKPVISNSSFMTHLNSSMPKLYVKIKSSTYRQTINTLACVFDLMYNVGPFSLLWNALCVR